MRGYHCEHIVHFIIYHGNHGFKVENSWVQNTSRPESQIKKKHLSISYHRCREAQAAGTIRIAKEGTKTNIADMFTKLLPGTKLRELCSYALW